jgi:hypothetical protein
MPDSLQRNRRARRVEENVEAATSVLSGVDLGGASDAWGGWSLGRGAVVEKRRRCGGLEIGPIFLLHDHTVSRDRSAVGFPLVRGGSPRTYQQSDFFSVRVRVQGRTGRQPSPVEI